MTSHICYEPLDSVQTQSEGQLPLTVYTISIEKPPPKAVIAGYDPPAGGPTEGRKSPASNQTRSSDRTVKFRPIDYQITRLPDYQITKLPNYQITKCNFFSFLQITKLPNYQFTRLTNYQKRGKNKVQFFHYFFKLLNYQITKLPDYQITKQEEKTPQVLSILTTLPNLFLKSDHNHHIYQYFFNNFHNYQITKLLNYFSSKTESESANTMVFLLQFS